MIDTTDLQAFLEKIQGGTIPVDLLKIGQAHYAQYANAGTTTLCFFLYTSFSHQISFLWSFFMVKPKITTIKLSVEKKKEEGDRKRVRVRWQEEMRCYAAQILGYLETVRERERKSGTHSTLQPLHSQTATMYSFHSLTSTHEQT